MQINLALKIAKMWFDNWMVNEYIINQRRIRANELKMTEK